NVLRLMICPPKVCVRMETTSLGAQTERRGHAGPVRSWLGGQASPANLLSRRFLPGRAWRLPGRRYRPDFHAAILAGRGQLPPIGMKRHVIGSPLMGAEETQQTAGFRVPAFHGAVAAGRGQAPAASAESHTLDRIAMSMNALLHLVSRHIP